MPGLSGQQRRTSVRCASQGNPDFRNVGFQRHLLALLD